MRASNGALLAAILVLAGACGGSDGGTPPADVNTMTKNAGDAQTATVGAAAAVAPSVKITNQNQAPVANVAVTFAVASGGGQVTGGSATTNASGIATVGSWTMGTTPGANTLSATAAGVNGSPVTFTATANAGAPATMTKQAGDNQTATPGQAVATRPAVKLVDQFQNPVAGFTVTFAVASGGGSVTGGSATTGADGIATVGNWTLGPNAGANTLTATISGTGVTGNPATFAATGQFAAFNPTSSVAISGNQTYGNVTIPAGVTVTVSSDAVITVNGSYTQAGVVNAPCHTLRVDATGLMTITGNISNDCSDPAADGNDLVLIGRAGYNISNNEIASSGDIWIMDGPQLSVNFTNTRVADARVMPDVAEAGPYRCRLVNMKLLARPLNKQKKPTGNPKGADGSSGTSRTSGCGQLLSGQTGGNLLVDGVTMTGGTGGAGGDGISQTSTQAEGGKGGEPGALNLVSDGDLDIQGTTTLNLGNGGAGGNATGTNNSAGGNASALGGRGSDLRPRNFASPVTILARRGSLTVTGTLRIVFGIAGAGGSATATGGKGADGSPGQKGGNATATGGNGGDMPSYSLTPGGNVVVLGTVDVTGGGAGAGGPAIANPGAGGNGNVPGAAGGPGGDGNSRGGNGGKGQPSPFVRNVPESLAATVLTAPGGAAGNSTFSGATGGNGAANCPNAGGAGGKGGNALGGGGDRGPGSTAGALATVTFNSYGNGGNGAAGGGAAGAGGANGTSLGSGATGVPPSPGSFQPGQPGAPCPGQVDVTVNLAVSTPPLNPGGVTPGTYTVQVLNTATQAVVGTMRFLAAAAAFYGTNPSRVGWDANGSWRAEAEYTYNGLLYRFARWRMCFINISISQGAPAFIEELDANLNVLSFRTIERGVLSGPGVSGRSITSTTPCQDFALNPLTRFIRWSGVGSGQFGDAYQFGGVGVIIPQARR